MNPPESSGHWPDEDAILHVGVNTMSQKPNPVSAQRIRRIGSRRSDASGRVSRAGCAPTSSRAWPSPCWRSGCSPPRRRVNCWVRPRSTTSKQGAEVAKLVEQQIGLYSMPKTEAYLREVGGRLVAAVNDPRWKFSFQIVDQQEPNAFAIPGGGIYVSRGLLALVNREDELAGVLAHEIAHVTQRHSARQQRKGILPGLLSLPGNVVGNVVGENLGALINAPIDTVGGAWLSRYSRGQESESDRIGIRTAAQAGYDPVALADMLRRLEQDVASQTGQERRFSIFDSHPMTETRLKDIHKPRRGLDAGDETPRGARRCFALREARRNVVGRKSRGGCLPEEPVPAAGHRFHHHFS